MADKKLKVLVTVHDEQGVAHLFGPNDTLPGWAREKITNPNVWDGDDVAEAPVRTPDAPKASKAAKAARGDKAAKVPEPAVPDDVDGDDEDDDEADGGDANDGDVDGVITDGAPPRSGKGSSLANWKTWADEQGVQYPAEVKQADLIALVDAAATSKE